MKTTLLSPLFFCFLLVGCTTDRAPEAPADTTAPTGAPASAQDTFASVQDTSASAPDSLSEADARRVLRAVYRPIHAFYQNMDTTGTGNHQPPEDTRTPAALREALTQTMAPDLARSFTEQLLMQRGDGYIVRPTENILTPYARSGPALEAVSVAHEDSAYVLTERYAKTALHGRVERQNVVRWEDGRWRLVDIR